MNTKPSTPTRLSDSAKTSETRVHINAPAKKKSKKRWLLATILGILLLGGGAAAVYYFVTPSDSHSKRHRTELDDDDDWDDDDSSAKKHRRRHHQDRMAMEEEELVVDEDCDEIVLEEVVSSVNYPHYNDAYDDEVEDPTPITNSERLETYEETEAVLTRNTVVETGTETSNDLDTMVFDTTDEMPSFPGGDGALLNFLGTHVQYPPMAEELGVQGRVICTFIVERDGSISNIQVVRSIDPMLDREAVRVLQSMPRWTPGKMNGEAVRVKYTVPITFRLS